jgi:hypothetical protein
MKYLAPMRKLQRIDNLMDDLRYLGRFDSFPHGVTERAVEHRHHEEGAFLGTEEAIVNDPNNIWDEKLSCRN